MIDAIYHTVVAVFLVVMACVVDTPNRISDLIFRVPMILLGCIAGFKAYAYLMGWPA